MATWLNTDEIKALVYEYIVEEKQYKDIEEFISLCDLPIPCEDDFRRLHQEITNKISKSMIFIAKDHKGRIIGIVSAKSEDSVKAYYQGAGLQYNTLERFNPDEDRDNEKSGYVTPILKTRRLEGYMLKDRSDVIVIE